MSQKINLTVVSATLSSNGGFIHKLQNKTSTVVDTPFGKKTQDSQVTYYMKLDDAAPIGMQAEIDIDNFKVVERPYTVPDTGEVLELKWLQLP